MSALPVEHRGAAVRRSKASSYPGRRRQDARDAARKPYSIRQRDPAECAVVVTSMNDTELFRVPVVGAPGVMLSVLNGGPPVRARLRR